MFEPQRNQRARMRYLYADAFRLATASIPIFKAISSNRSSTNRCISREQRLARSRFYKHSSETPGAPYRANASVGRSGNMNYNAAFTYLI
jgi:hypothetical protein